jgi:hypothetical protein
MRATVMHGARRHPNRDVPDPSSSRRSVRRYARSRAGHLVIMPFAFSGGTCVFCAEGLTAECAHVGFFGRAGVNGAQAKVLRIPDADGTLFALPARQLSMLVLDRVRALDSAREPAR